MEAENQFHLYGSIEKMDAGAGFLMVSGIASTEAVDADGEVVTADAMRKALPAYLQCGTVREMHQPIAAGVPISAFVDEDGKTHFTAKIVDQGTIDKIKAGVLKGFSIGGKAVKKVGNKIMEILLKDISVVDLPNNPQSFFTVIKFDKPEDKCMDKSCEHCKEPMSKCDGKCAGAMEKAKNNKSMSDHMKKLDDLAATVDSLAKTVETLAKSIPASQSDELSKALTAIGDLQKKATDTQNQVTVNERKAIITKMDNEGRVAINPETAVAFKRDELEKMDLSLLKFAAANSKSVPLNTLHVYRGDAKPEKVDSNLKGAAKTEAIWEKKYESFDSMRAAQLNA